jgi:hypothetical protein
MTDDEYINAVLARIGLPTLGQGGSDEEKMAKDLYLPGIRRDYFVGKSVDDAAQHWQSKRAPK